jgi:non-ribosomal peptide synthetase component F
MLCHMEEGSNNLRITVNYDSNILQKREAERLVEQFHNVLYQLFEKQSIPLQEIEVISKEDRAQLAIWHRQLPSATAKALHDIVLEHCSNRPDAEAISSWDGKLNYRELDDLSARLAQYLLTFSSQPEGKIAVCLQKSCWSIVAMLAVLRTGYTCVVIDPAHPRLRIEQMIQKAKPDLMLASAAHQELVHGLVGSTISISSEFILSLPLIHMELPTVHPNQAAFILFTSGSTGTPKGIVMEHVNWSTSVSEAGPAMGFTSDTRCLHFAAYAFDASIYEVFNT